MRPRPSSLATLRQTSSEEPTMDERELWRELGQQLRVDAVRASAKAKSGHPTSSMSAADLAAVLLAKHFRYDFEQPEQPDERPPDLLEGSRVAARLRPVPRRRRDLRGGVHDLPPVREPPRGAPDAGAARGSTSRPARSGRGCRSASAWRSPASGSTGCRSASGSSAATARWRRARCGRRSSTRPSTSSTT